MLGNLHDEHPWKSARHEFDNIVLPKLKKHGLAIGQRANEGDEHCKKIMKYYDLLHASFDPMTLVFLKEELKDAGY